MDVLGSMFIILITISNTIGTAPRPLTNELEPDEVDLSNPSNMDDLVSTSILFNETDC